MNERILIVEDEIKLAHLLKDYFTLEKFASYCIHDGAEVVDWVKENQPSVILLDIMLPNKDGMQLCQELRQFTNVPILMVTAKVEEIDRLLGLELGADDYICKPFSPKEVVARVKAVLRRINGNYQVNSSFALDQNRLKISFSGQSLELTAVEFYLLKTMFKESGRIFTREQLMQHMYEDNRIVSDRTIDSHIKKLRKKLATLCPEREIIHSVYGVGYRLDVDT
ncbi:DNA-binding response regulator [Thalassotalea insulae]|uniref:DNA-binding response regulator n=1 Tax=Thalassotalea insulae TaxID=2056778 RepID=A0ABQ6GS08_9GAMM|nr:response regulator [Thalassotalea insulae]GLX77476.1 DNA-binding response regulator [Thalassotalea insulae]